MFNVTKKSIEWGEETLTLETGKVARQADGSVIATLGETIGDGKRDLCQNAKARSGLSFP